MLKKEKHTKNFFVCSRFLTAKFNILRKPTVDENISSIFAPALFSYIWWVLFICVKKEIKTLYFFARDGFIMYKIATMFCEKFNLPIECKYLYCSRLSLRIPSFSIIGDEAYNLIFSGGYKISPYIILKRIGLNKDERNSIYSEINLNNINEKKTLSKLEYSHFTEKMKKSNLFSDIVLKKSKLSYNDTIGYLRQEGLLDLNHIAIVDSGWTGSMQRTLRQLINSTGNYPKITGFYFGLFDKSKDVRDGEYLSWYFNEKSNPFIKSKFNNNLFECLCSAPHEMTIGYKFENGKYVPFFKPQRIDNQKIDFINSQVSNIEKINYELLKYIDFYQFDNNINLKLAKIDLKRLMVKPTKNQALEYSNFTFSDDVNESYYNTLTFNLSKKEWRKHLLFKRLKYKYLKSNNNLNENILFWDYGSLALSNIKIKWFYRFNILLWDVLRFLKKKSR